MSEPAADLARRSPDVSFYTVDDLVQRWRCSKAAVYRFVEDGRLPAVRIGGRMLRFRPQDIDAFEEDA